MDSKKRLGKSIVALLLFATLMMPTAIEFIHMFEGHEHITCNDRTTLIHKSVVKCDICHFHLAYFDYDIAKYPNLLLPKIPLRIKANFISLQFYSFKIINTLFRGPPIFS